jgi:pilus assembly protein Flp/PilA
MTPIPSTSPTAKGPAMNLTRIRRLLQSEDAATAMEYAVLLALILVVLISAITAVGNSTSGVWQNDVTRISNASNGS